MDEDQSIENTSKLAKDFQVLDEKFKNILAKIKEPTVALGQANIKLFPSENGKSNKPGIRSSMVDRAILQESSLLQQIALPSSTPMINRKLIFTPDSTLTLSPIAMNKKDQAAELDNLEVEGVITNPNKSVSKNNESELEPSVIVLSSLNESLPESNNKYKSIGGVSNLNETLNKKTRIESIVTKLSTSVKQPITPKKKDVLSKSIQTSVKQKKRGRDVFTEVLGFLLNVDSDASSLSDSDDDDNGVECDNFLASLKMKCVLLRNQLEIGIPSTSSAGGDADPWVSPNQIKRNNANIAAVTPFCANDRWKKEDTFIPTLKTNTKKKVFVNKKKSNKGKLSNSLKQCQKVQPHNSKVNILSNVVLEKTGGKSELSRLDRNDGIYDSYIPTAESNDDSDNNIFTINDSQEAIQNHVDQEKGVQKTRKKPWRYLDETDETSADDTFLPNVKVQKKNESVNKRSSRGRKSFPKKSSSKNTMVDKSINTSTGVRVSLQKGLSKIQNDSEIESVETNTVRDIPLDLGIAVLKVPPNKSQHQSNNKRRTRGKKSINTFGDDPLDLRMPVQEESQNQKNVSNMPVRKSINKNSEDPLDLRIPIVKDSSKNQLECGPTKMRSKKSINKFQDSPLDLGIPIEEKKLRNRISIKKNRKSSILKVMQRNRKKLVDYEDSEHDSVQDISQSQLLKSENVKRRTWDSHSMQTHEINKSLKLDNAAEIKEGDNTKCSLDSNANRDYRKRRTSSRKRLDANNDNQIQMEIETHCSNDKSPQEAHKDPLLTNDQDIDQTEDINDNVMKLPRKTVKNKISRRRISKRELSQLSLELSENGTFGDAAGLRRSTRDRRSPKRILTYVLCSSESEFKEVSRRSLKKSFSRNKSRKTNSTLSMSKNSESMITLKSSRKNNELCSIVEENSVTSSEEPQYVELENVAGVTIAKLGVVNGSDSWSLKIAGGHEKPQQVTNSHSLSFQVEDGRAEVGIGKTKKEFSKGGTFLVPRGSQYYIKNINKRKNLILTFTRILPLN